MEAIVEKMGFLSEEFKAAGSIGSFSRAELESSLKAEIEELNEMMHEDDKVGLAYLSIHYY